MKILTVDIGNTATKGCVFESERLQQSVVSRGGDLDTMEMLMNFHSVDGVAYCCVGTDDMGVREILRREFGDRMLELSGATALPIAVEYARDKLGVDRVAAAVGVADKGAVLLVDAGTAVTSDIIAGNAFKGGNISPGLKLRFRSLNKFTSRLPLVSPTGDMPDFGEDTTTAIRSGVVRGLVAQIVDDYTIAKREYPEIKLILTGGDADILSPLIAARGIEAVIDHEAVGRGLVRIYNYNRQ